VRFSVRGGAFCFGIAASILGGAGLGTGAYAQAGKASLPDSPANGDTGAADSAAGDPLLVAMKDELAREREQLLLPGMQRPYFIEYRLEDVHNYQLSASYGALTGESENRQRFVRVEVRIGNYKVDSSSARGNGSLALAPGDNDPDALREALWTATDEAYKAALRAYAAKLAALKQFQNPPTADDFTPADPVTAVEPAVELNLDRAEWKRRLVEASGLYAKDPAVMSFAPDVQYSSASLNAMVVNRYTVNTDGTAVRRGFSSYEDTVSVGGQAADGMELGRNNGSTAVTAEGLEDWASLRKRTLDDLQSFEALRQAPLVDAEDYHGPVLFSGDAAADVVNRLFVPNIVADRPEMGTLARTVGAYQSSYRSTVLPSFLSVVDDPTLREFKGKRLVGAYKVDDQGEPAKPVTVVEHGKLVSYLVSREPVKDFPASNGHGRAALGGPVHPHASVLVVKTDQSLSSEQLRAKLLSLAKDQGRDVYEVETLGGGELMPRLLYRVSPDGKRTLVRGAAFDELDQRTLRSEILAAGGDPFVAQQMGPMPQTTITPALLFADITVKRATQAQEKLPYYPPPSVSSR
jgi:TldD protein